MLLIGALNDAECVAAIGRGIYRSLCCSDFVVEHFILVGKSVRRTLHIEYSLLVGKSLY